MGYHIDFNVDTVTLYSDVHVYMYGSVVGNTGKKLDVDNIQHMINETMERPIPVYIDGEPKDTYGVLDPFNINRLVGFAQLIRDDIGINCRITYTPTTTAGKNIMELPMEELDHLTANFVLTSSTYNNSDESEYLDVISIPCIEISFPDDGGK